MGEKSAVVADSKARILLSPIFCLQFKAGKCFSKELIRWLEKRYQRSFSIWVVIKKNSVLKYELLNVTILFYLQLIIALHCKVFYFLGREKSIQILFGWSFPEAVGTLW